MKNAVLTLILAAMLFGIAISIPSGEITDSAKAQYMNETVDDEYDFL